MINHKSPVVDRGHRENDRTSSTGYIMDAQSYIAIAAHTGSWAGTPPEIVASANMFRSLARSAPLAAEPVKNVVGDVTKMFPGSLYHGRANEIDAGKPIHQFKPTLPKTACRVYQLHLAVYPVT